MQLLDMRCPACGGIIQNVTGRVATCEYCGSRFALEGEEAAAFVEDADQDAEEEEEGEGLTIDEFAAEVCQDFLDEYDNGGSFRSSPKILRGLDIGDDEEVYLIHDDTMFKSGKNGFAITDCGLYCRDMSGEPCYIDWETFARLNKPRKDDSYIACGGRHVCYFTDDNDLFPPLLDLYTDLHDHARRCYE